MKIVIAFFYLLHGDLVSYTVSDYTAFQREAKIPATLACERLIEDEGFGADVRKGFAEGESMRADCYRTDDPMVLGTPYHSVLITRP
ncbi:hypothetical protein [Iodidimonas sp. SYSU 1G8]|uniref:hypothetical protein n=1 Tax=Iodidimonas sp. SYSU 1G8 TaxID=3133967 RepID=UPI0031FF30DD